MKRGHKGLIVLGILLIIAVMNLVPYIREERSKQRAEKMMGQMTPGKMGKAGNVPEELGNKDAKVVIKVSMPGSACFAPIITEFLDGMLKEYPDKLYVKFEEVMLGPSKAGCGSAVYVSINGKSEFTIKRGGKAVKVVFRGPMAHSGEMGAYSADDLRVVISEEVKKVYGDEGSSASSKK